MASGGSTVKVAFLGDTSSLNRAMKSAEAETGRFSKGISGAKKIVGAFALAGGAAAAFSFAKGLIADAEESAKVARLTTNVIKSTGGAAKVTAAQVGKLSTAISNKTGVDDEAIQSGQNLLLTFTNIKNGVGASNQIFDQASQAITDMTASMHDGNVTADGLKTSSIQLGKALNDPVKGITALTKVGVSFTQGQKDSIKAMVAAGDTMGAQKIILGELSKEFGGAAEAASTPAQKATVAWRNLREQLGSYLLPMVAKVATFLSTRVIPVVSTFFDNVAHGKGKFAEFRDAVQGGIDRLKKLSGVLGTVRADIGKAFDTLGTLDLGGAGKDFAKQAEGWAASIIGGVKTGFDRGDWAPLGKSIGSGIATALNSAVDLAGKLFAWLDDQIARVKWVDLGLAIGRQVPALLTGLVIGLLNFDFGAVLHALADHWMLALLGVFTLATDGIGGKLPALLEKIPFGGKLAAWFVTKLHEGAAALLGAIGTLGAQFAAGMTRALEGSFPRLAGVLERGVLGLVHLLVGEGPKLGGTARGWVEKISGAISALPGRLATIAGDAVGRLLSGLLNSFPRVLKFAGKMAPNIVSAIGNLGSLLIHAGEDLVMGLIHGIESKIPSVTGVLHKLTDLIPFHKGPASKDKKLLTANGQTIIGGLVRGLESQYPAVQASLRSLTMGIPNMATPALAGAGGAPAAPLSGSSRSPLTLRLEIDVHGDDAETVRRIRKQVRVAGGNVQTVLGS